jgi:four helix bundle protein
VVEGRRDLTERAFAFAVQIVNLCRLLDERSGVPRTLANQLLRSGTSIGANIHEGQGSQSEADLIINIL